MNLEEGLRNAVHTAIKDEGARIVERYTTEFRKELESRVAGTLVTMFKETSMVMMGEEITIKVRLGPEAIKDGNIFR